MKSTALRAIAACLSTAAFAVACGGGTVEDTTPPAPAPAPSSPSSADAGPANAALPPGADISFTTAELDLDDGRQVSAVVPVGWSDDRPGQSGRFTAPVELADQYGLFDALDYQFSCEGVCEPQDWEAVVDGFIGSFTGWQTTRATPVAGSAGRVVELAADDGSVRGFVFRWENTDAFFFSCQVDLEADNAELLPAFMAACEASRPGWIAVS